MVFRDIIFFIAATGALAGALGVVMLRNPFFSVLALVAHLFSLAILFLLLSSEFLAAAQLVVYAGAVMVLYVFVVAYIGGADEPLGPKIPGIGMFGPVVAAALCGELFFAFIGTGLEAVDSSGTKVAPGFGSPGQIGSLLLRNFLIPFEAASFILLVAAVGAVLLARRRRGLEHDDGGAPVDVITHERLPDTHPQAGGVAPGVGS
ncbi:MAG: NADH-quinone oxidoreductase subunit J [Thermoleophilaceae bacterium]